MFCWPCIIAYQYSETNVMHFLFNLLRIKGLYMFRALLAHPHEALGILRECYVSWLLPGLEWNCFRNMYRPLILNKLNKKCITLASLYWNTYTLRCQLWPSRVIVRFCKYRFFRNMYWASDVDVFVHISANPKSSLYNCLTQNNSRSWPRHLIKYETSR
jgi:hypothetical protein